MPTILPPDTDNIFEGDTVRGHAAAAEWLNDHGYPIKHKTLVNMGSLGTGPTYRKWGNTAVYKIIDLRAWAKARWR